MIDMTGGTSCQKFNFQPSTNHYILQGLLCLLSTMSASKKNDQIYLNEKERSLLQSLLQDWSGMPNKKTCDTFVSGTVLPKIQELNLQDYGSDVIATNKVAKAQWEKRISVSYFSVYDGAGLDLLLSFLFRRSTPGSKTISHSRTGRCSRLKERYPSGGW